MDKLDKKDLALLKELDFDARASISSLARKIRVSKEVANYRLKRLLDEGIIKGFTAIIDPFTLGYQLYTLQVRLKEIDTIKRKAVVEWCKKNENSAILLTLGGKWDFSISFWSRNPAEFDSIYESFMERFGAQLLKKSVSIVIEIEHLPYNFIYEKPNFQHIILGKFGDLKIDKIDYKILDIFSKNCRMSLMDVAKGTGVTANAIKYRIKALKEKGIIKGYRTVIDYSCFNLSHYRVTLHLSDPSKKKDVRNFLGQQQDIVFVYKMMGGGDLKFDLICKDAKRVYELVDDLNHLRPGIVREFDEIICLNEEVADYFPNN